MKKPLFSFPFLKFSNFLVAVSFALVSGIAIFSTAEATATVFSRNLRIGMVGADVKLLQTFLNSDQDTKVSLIGPGSPGNETFYFGPATLAAVKRFQEKYRQEVLIPAGIFQASGYVGTLTRLKISAVLASTAKNSLSVSITEKNTAIVASSTAPRIYSVSPNRVQAGNMVVITGEGFTPTGNTVILGDGPVNKKFSNLPSPDGKTITFTYEPPIVQTMTEAQIRALPPNVFSQINDAVIASGQSLSDVLTPYKGVNSMSELAENLKKNNHSIDEIYHFFHVIVENPKGKGMSQTALLRGLPAVPFQTAMNGAANDLFSYISKAMKFLVPTANAQLAGGGFDMGIIMFCTCNGGVLVWLQDYSGPGTGLHWFYPGFVPIAGTGLVPSMWLGFYQLGAGQCWIGVPPFCGPIPANIPFNPWGASA